MLLKAWRRKDLETTGDDDDGADGGKKSEAGETEKCHSLEEGKEEGGMVRRSKKG